MRPRALVLAAAVLFAVPLIPSPAGAAVPKTKATVTIACPDGVGAARIWYKIRKQRVTKLAIDNLCSQFLAFDSGNHYAGGDPHSMHLVAPGVHFNWGKKRLAMYGSLNAVDGWQHWENEDECGGPTTVVVVYRYNDVRHAVDEYGESC